MHRKLARANSMQGDSQAIITVPSFNGDLVNIAQFSICLKMLVLCDSLYCEEDICFCSIVIGVTLNIEAP